MFNDTFAYQSAIAIVTAGLQSNVIKLNGAITSADYIQGNFEADAKYLNGLINSLAKNLTNKKD